MKMPKIPVAVVTELSAGVICLTAGYGGTLNRLIANDQLDIATDFLNTLHTAFGDRLYIELHRTNNKDNDKVENCIIGHGV